MPGSGAVGVAARRPRRFGLRWSSWHWAPRGHMPRREKSGHSSVCFFLHCGRRAQLGEPVETAAPHRGLPASPSGAHAEGFLLGV